MKKPIRIFYSLLGQRFYASSQYRINKNGTATITGEKTDVTNDIAAAIIEHEITFVRTENKSDLPPMPEGGV